MLGYLGIIHASGTDFHRTNKHKTKSQKPISNPVGQLSSYGARTQGTPWGAFTSKIYGGQHLPAVCAIQPRGTARPTVLVVAELNCDTSLFCSFYVKQRYSLYQMSVDVRVTYVITLKETRSYVGRSEGQVSPIIKSE